MFTAIIPARGGSKRIPNKNVAQVAGKPLIAWTVETALACGVFERIIVSTDCSDIAKVAQAAGASVPGLRPANISDDHATLDLVLRNAIEAYDVTSDWVVLVYATACLMRPEILKQAAALARTAPQDIDFVMGVQAYPHPIQRAITMKNDQVQLVSAEHAKTRTQDLEEYYHDAGQFVFGRRTAWLSGHTVWDRKTLGVQVSQKDAVDIDTPDDLALAEILMNARMAPSWNA